LSQISEIVFEVEREWAERWSDVLMEAGALAVNAQDADADSADEQPLFGEPGGEPTELAWNRTRLLAMIDQATTAAEIMSTCAEALELPLPEYRLQSVPDADWVRITQAQFEPIPVGNRLVITPSWHAENVSAERLAIIVDPGLAFGTGSHPTTRLCLEWLDAHMPNGATVIDYGCGSGILAIAAARLGASQVRALDIDPQAVLSTQSNAQINQVQIAVQASDAPINGQAQVVLANILASPLKLLAPLLCGLVAPGGHLILSGVLERQIEEVSAFYRPHLPIQAWAVRDGWACLVCH
jgi:ribosomal protein L11 methyltransferase